MNIRENNHRMSFEEKRCQVRCLPETRSVMRLQFELEWEVLVARYDPESGNYVTRTYCCEDVIAD